MISVFICYSSYFVVYISVVGDLLVIRFDYFTTIFQWPSINREERTGSPPEMTRKSDQARRDKRAASATFSFSYKCRT